MKHRKIFKYSLEIVQEQRIEMPAGCKVLGLQMQRGVPALWVEIDPKEPMISYRIRMVGTGHDFDAYALHYLGTVQDGPLVWHYYWE